MVAVDPLDAALTAAAGSALSGLASGIGVADRDWSSLVGGTIALTGRDVAIVRTADLGGEVGPGPLVLTLADFAASLAAAPNHTLPNLRTLAVVQGVPNTVPAGWRALLTETDGVPLDTGLHIAPEADAA